MKIIEPKPKPFPVVRITGGPHGKNTVVEIDGEPMKGLTRLELEMDARDAVKMRLWRIVEAEVDLSVLPEDAKAYIRVNIRQLQPNLETDAMDRVTVATGDGETLREALLAAAASLPE